MMLADTITPVAKSIRTILTSDTTLASKVGTRVYLANAPENAVYPHVILTCAAAPELDATHTDLSWQQQQWDIYAVTDSADQANSIIGDIARILNDASLSVGAGKTLVCRRWQTMSATRARISDSIDQYLAYVTMMIGVKTGGA